jgi:hypothetical protein
LPVTSKGTFSSQSRPSVCRRWEIVEIVGPIGKAISDFPRYLRLFDANRAGNI